MLFIQIGFPVSALRLLTTDRGSQFKSRLFQVLTQLIGARRVWTTFEYHPSSNGMVERFHRSLNSAIRCHANSEWIDILPSILFGLRASVKDLKTSAAEMIYGTPIRLPREFFINEELLEDPQIFIKQLREHTYAKYVLHRQRITTSLKYLPSRTYSWVWMPLKNLLTALMKDRTR